MKEIKWLHDGSDGMNMEVHVAGIPVAWAQLIAAVDDTTVPPKWWFRDQSFASSEEAKAALQAAADRFSAEVEK